MKEITSNVIPPFWEINSKHFSVVNTQMKSEKNGYFVSKKIYIVLFIHLFIY